MPNHRIENTILVVVWLALLLNPMSALSSETELAKRVDACLEPFAEAGHLSGCILLAEGDEVLHERCFGWANAELSVPNDPDTRFAIASLTKSLQLVLTARLVEEGSLALDDRLARWLPGFPRADSLRILDLAQHTAGVPHRVTESDAETVARTPQDMVELVIKKGLLEEQVGQRNYSSAGYSVLARVLELAGGAAWEDLMEEYVFEPCRMSSTVHPSDRRMIPDRADSYRWTLDGLVNTEPKDLSFLVGAGSLYSTPRDLWRAARAVVGGDLGETAQEYVLGDEALRSNGLTNGYRAFLDYDLQSDRAAVVCANVVTGALGKIRDALPKLLSGEDLPAPRVPDLAMAVVDPASLEVYAGMYELRPGTLLDVHPRGAALYANDWLLIPQGGDHFFCVQDYSPVTFIRRDDGEIERMDWGEPAYQIPRVADREAATPGAGAG